MKSRRFHPFLLSGLLVLSLQGLLLADGLPGEYLLTQRWRAMHSLHSPLANPAYMTEENYFALHGVYSPVLQNTFRLWEVGATIPIGLYQSAGISILGEDDGEIQSGYVDQSGRVVPGDAIDGNLSSLFLLSYAINPWKALSVGVNVLLAYQGNFGESRKGVGLDVGLTYRVLNHPAFGYHLVGLSTQNLLAPTMGVSFTPDFESAGQYARNLKLSWFGAFLEKRLDGGLELNIRDFLAQADQFKVPSSADSAQLLDAAANLEVDFSARVGVWLLRLFRLAVQFGVGENEEKYLGVAGGVNIPSTNNGRDLEMLYQYTSMLQGSEASSHSIYVRADLGKHREELYARRIAKFLDLSPNELYNKACALYFAKNYWDAFFIFGQILSQFPDFFKNDWVSFYLGSCQERLDMRGSGRKRFEQMLEQYPESDAIHYANLGLMRIAYRERDVLSVTRQFGKLIQIHVPDSLKQHACYLMAETNMREKEFAKAIQFFSTVSEKHPMYVFAQHSMAICHIIRGENEQAKEALGAAISAEVQTREQKEMVNRSLLLIGYLFYEEQVLTKAVSALRKVPPTSYYYEDALLGLGWSALKARQWIDCATAGITVQSISKKPVLQCEGMLLEAFPLIMTQDYAGAIKVLQAASEKVKDLSPPPQDSLTQRTSSYDNNRFKYETLSGTMNDLADSRQSEMGIKMVDSLHVDQKALKTSLEEFMRYQDEFGRFTFFARGIEDVKDDINYALATAEKLRATGKSVKEGAKEVEQKKQLDDEIKKLKEEMQKLEGK